MSAQHLHAEALGSINTTHTGMGGIGGGLEDQKFQGPPLLYNEFQAIWT